MLREEIYKNLLTAIAQCLKDIGSIKTEEEFADITDSLNTGKPYKSAFEDVSLKEFQGLIKVIDSINDELEESVTSSSFVYIHPLSALPIPYESIFIDAKTYGLLILTTSALRELGKEGTSDQNNESILKIIEQIWPHISNKNDLREKFLKGFQENEEYVVIGLSHEVNSQEIENMYAYCYFNWVNKYGIQKSESLNFVDRPFQNSSIPYSDKVQFNQFYDIYALIGEAHYHTNILQRYVNMYHIIEYICYRKILSDITKNPIGKSGFVRRVISKVTNASNKEKDTIVKGIQQLFPNFGSEVATMGLNPFIGFVKAEYDFFLADTTIPRLVYEIRCSIIHNKATEFHFSFSNIQDYTIILPLIDKIIEVGERQIVAFINQPNNEIEYADKTIDLY